MENAVRTRRDSLVTEHTAWTYDTDRKRHLLHSANLNRRSVGTEEDRVVAVADEECVLHLAGRVLRREVERLEYMPVILDLWSLGNIIAELA